METVEWDGYMDAYNLHPPTGATIGAGTTYASEAPEFTPGFLSELPLFNLVFCSNLRIIVPLFLVGFVLHHH